MKISIVVPAHNEEKYIGKCLTSISDLEVPSWVELEVLVVLNRCTDRTESIARGFGARVVSNDSKNLSSIRNEGVKAATGEWIVTIDADSWLSENTLVEICKGIDSKKVVGGGITMRPERWSFGIAVGYFMVALAAVFSGVSFGLYWFKKEYFESINGFDESKLIGEDMDFYTRLKKHGRSISKGHKKIYRSHITTSCRKFDQFGDWYFLRIYSNPLQVSRAEKGTDQKFLDKYWYDVKR
jgi:glycosyltransferase involved in cell wall biosynthesis